VKDRAEQTAEATTVVVLVIAMAVVVAVVWMIVIMIVVAIVGRSSAAARPGRRFAMIVGFVGLGVVVGC
jgi:hypothetical protein